MKVIIKKPDLDTCLTALILEVTENDEIIVLRGPAPEVQLNDPAVCCIEVGGSGQVQLNNFDHHDIKQSNPPACQQAYNEKQLPDVKLNRLVAYVCMVDVRLQDHPPIPFPSLSNIFSGMLLSKKSPLQQFICGMEMLRKVLKADIDPFQTMPDFDEWRDFKSAKKRNFKILNEDLKDAVIFQSQSDRKVGFLETTAFGGSGNLYKRGCDAVILMNHHFGEADVRKTTISGNRIQVDHLVAYISSKEKGWGGQDTGTIISFEGSILSKEEIIELVRKYL